jgi:predicted secreted Zn-dependent protease
LAATRKWNTFVDGIKTIKEKKKTFMGKIMQTMMVKRLFFINFAPKLQ